MINLLPVQEVCQHSAVSILLLFHEHSEHGQRHTSFYSVRSQKFCPSKHHMIQDSVG